MTQKKGRKIINVGNVREELKKLALIIRETIDDKIRKKKIKPAKDIYYRLKVLKFYYTDKGVTRHSGHEEHFTKENWLGVIFRIEQQVKYSEEYKAALKELTTVFKDNSHIQDDLNILIREITSYYLVQKRLDNKVINNFVIIFIKELRGEPLDSWADVEIIGLALEPDEVRLSSDIMLRKVKKEDLEKEVRAFDLSRRDRFQVPSAIIKVQYKGHNAAELQQIVEKTISILRLFKVGSVRYIQYSMHSKAITRFIGGTIGAGGIPSCSEWYSLDSNNIKQLKSFFRFMDKCIPINFYGFGQKKSNITIAYNRYCDAILQNDILEKRIAHVMMGLEALLLDDNLELCYKLKTRVSKLFALIGLNQYQVKKEINDAYRIRSTFAHGSTIKEKDKIKLETEYGSLNKLLSSILDYLRIVILIQILIKVKKNTFLKQLDDSLIDDKKAKELKKQLSKFKLYI